MNPVKVAIIDDHATVRRGLSAILNTFEAVQLVGEAGDGEQALELCQLAEPEVVLMDLMMPRMDGHDPGSSRCRCARLPAEEYQRQGPG